MIAPREYVSDDRDVEANRLRTYQGDNGDWYVVILRPGERIGVSVRVTTSGASRDAAHVAPAVAALHRAMRPADPEPVECTGVAASWCPVHGDCTCPRDRDGFREETSTCPLHNETSTHAHEGDLP